MVLRLKVVKMDVTKEEHLQSVAHDIKKDHGSLDLLINCAAMLHPSGRGETSLKQVRAEVSCLLLFTAAHSFLFSHIFL